MTICQVCSKKLKPNILNLGLHPLCDDLIPINSNKINRFYRINISYCKNCFTAFQTHNVNKNKLFPKNYHYRAQLTADVINDEFIHKFDFFGSAIFQIIDKVESQHLRLDSIHLLLKKLCDEINESTNQKSLCTYGNDDDYYHWIECLSWQSFSNFINNQSNLKNADTANLLELLRDAINNHFEMLKIEDITSLLGPEPFFEDPFQIMDDWLNGLEELIDRYE